MTAAVADREIRRVRYGSAVVPLGVLAGSGRAHSFVPDQASGTSCLLCFGWSDDNRHLGRPTAVAS